MKLTQLIVTAICVFLAGTDSSAGKGCLGSPMPEIHEAAAAGDVAKVTLLLSADPELARTTDPGHGTPLHVATTYGRDDVVVVLVAKGADVNAKNRGGDTPIDIAVRIRGNDKVVATLIANGATSRPLHMACAYGNTKIVELLLANKADPTAQENNTHRRYLPIHCAAENGNVDIVKILLSRKIDVNVPDAYGNTPLHLAAKSASLEMVRFLVANGARVNAISMSKTTPLHLAASRMWNESFVEALVSAGADINAKDKNGTTPLGIAVKRGEAGADFLREHGGVE